MLAKRGLLRRHHDDVLEEGSFLDLGSMGFEEMDGGIAGARCVVRLAEVLRFEDLHQATKLAYGGDVVFIDYTSISNDAIAVKRMSIDLKNIAKDVGGDVAGIGKNMLVLTPAGIKVDRQKVRSELGR
ncbi:MAG: cell division protein SepF [Thermoplasmata archaeon]|jgi:SepF-like predicted cell division protein (DUF552 family)|nr:cell division protein SepF [Thermoplasmata archaeon]